MSQVSAPITIFLTPKCKITNSAHKIGQTLAGFEMEGFDLIGQTGTREKSYITEGLNACTGGVFLGKKLNMFHENSSIYKDAEGSKFKIFEEITKKIFELSNKGREKAEAFLFGGWGYGCGGNIEEVKKSHNLFNNIAICIEDIIPEKEGLKVPLTTIWGKLNSSKPDMIYARNNTIVLENDIFNELLNKKEYEINRNNIINFLEKHYEEVQIPDHVNIVAKKNYSPLDDIIENNRLKRQKTFNVTI